MPQINQLIDLNKKIHNYPIPSNPAGITGRTDKNKGRFFKRLLVFLIIILAIFAGWKLFKNGNTRNSPVKQIWYSVKLANSEVYYGQIANVASDPVVLNNVYYDYDQGKTDGKNAAETSNLRLVKRGNETYGPSGVMNIVRSQVLFMEPLKADSKVLKAILEYEKKQ